MADMGTQPVWSVVVCVEGGMVQGAYTDARGAHIHLTVVDLDVSSYPSEGEMDELEKNKRRIAMIEADPHWRAIY